MARRLHDSRHGAIQASQTVGDRFARQDLTRLPQGWDGDGADRISSRTWHQALSLVRTLAARTYKATNVEIPTPKAIPLRSGSVDLSWKSKLRELTVNVPEDVDEPVEFYGLAPGNLAIQGELSNDDAFDQVATWLSARE